MILLGLLVGLLVTTPDVPAGPQGLPSAEPSFCPEEGEVRLVSFHYIVAGVRHERLDGHIATGDAFTLVVGLQACGSRIHDVAMEFVMPPCQVRPNDARLAWVEELNSRNVTDDAEALMVQDLRAALTCDPLMPQAFASAAIASVTFGAIGTLAAVFVLRERRG